MSLRNNNRRTSPQSTTTPGPSLSSLQMAGILIIVIYLLVTTVLVKTFHSTTSLFGVAEKGHISRFLDRSVADLSSTSTDTDGHQPRHSSSDRDGDLLVEGGRRETTSTEGASVSGGGRGGHGRVLTAYLEPVYQSDWKVKPLPRRNSTASVLKAIAYPNVNYCSKLPETLPVDDPPTDVDPFLPWIHDVFPTADGKYIQFVAQNRRRCQSGRDFSELKRFLQPNIALFQHIPLARVNITDDAPSGSSESRKHTSSTTRYRLSSHEEADRDGIETRFICRFQPSGEETLSVYNFNYDWHSKRKGYKYTFTEDGFDVHMIWSSQLHFKCPVPPSLVETVKLGLSVTDDKATLFVDVIPVRTPPRYGYPNQFLPPKYNKPYTFIAEDEWGDAHILPKIEDSGRWENIPICKPSLMTYVDSLPSPGAGAGAGAGATIGKSLTGHVAMRSPDPEKPREKEVGKRYELIACVWTSASFHTRGERRHITDNSRRLREWLEFHLMTGFDHVFIYDNSGAQDDGTSSLKPITDLFSGQVTRINWPSKVCNNRPGSGDNKGERSSQYAAESSCRLRFGVHSNWIGAFDIDEYMIPMGDHTSMKQVIANMYERGVKILNFKSMRAWPRRLLLR